MKVASIKTTISFSEFEKVGMVGTVFHIIGLYKTYLC